MAKEKKETIAKFLKAHWVFIVICIFSISYVIISMNFLNGLYAEGLLFPWVGEAHCKLYFSSDVFDVFWLIIAAIPNGVFSLCLARDICEENTSKKWKRWVGLISLAIMLSFFVGSRVTSTTNAFNNNSGVWSAALSPKTASLYAWLGCVSVFILTMEFLSVCLGLLLRIKNGKIDSPRDKPLDSQSNTPTPQNIALRILIAATIIALYWLMLILSGIVNDKLLGGRVGNPALFPPLYFSMGIVITFLISLSAYFYLRDFPGRTTSLKNVVYSVVIPCIPVIIQLLQIIFANTE